MRNLVKLSILLFPFFCGGTLLAQQFGGNPPSIKWRQVNTPAARVIFPVGMDSAGTRVADIISSMNSKIQPTIGFKQRQISILLQNQTTLSNGYVGLAPFRSEYYLTPDQNSFELGSLHWADQLAVHEFRHVQQYNNFNVGGSKFLRLIFGEGGQAVGNELSIPNWFFEGDAVFNETYVTSQGRGRLPYFFNGYRALWAAGKNYSWMKLRNGSYQDYVPDWYPMGYMLVSYGREKYGDAFWKNVTHEAAAFDGLFYPLQKAIKQHSGIDFKQFRSDAFRYYQQQFNQPVVTQPVKKGGHFIADEEYPAYVDDHTIIYTKSTYDRPAAFVIRTGNEERVVSGRGYSLDNYFDYRDGKIIYAAYRPDLRWGYRDYQEIMLVDVQSGSETRITKGTKYFSPSLNGTGKQIVAVQIKPDGGNELHILDLQGAVLRAIPNKDNLFYTYPRFYGDRIISAVRKSDGSMSIALVDPATGSTEYLLAFSIKPIAFPSIHNNLVYFSATSGKSDGLFALSLITKKLYRLQNDALSADIGNYQPTVSGDHHIAWVGFTAYGYRVHQADSSKVQWQEIAGGSLPGDLPDFGIKALKQGEAVGLLATVTNIPQPVTKYHKAFHLINFHTLQPDFSDPNYSVALQGENILNTLKTQVSFNYNRNEGYKEFGLGTVYGALFPYLSAGVDYIIDREAFDHNNPVYFNQLQYHAGFQLPFNLTQAHHSTGLTVGSDVVYSRNFFSPPYDNANNSRQLVYLNNYLSFSSSSRTAKKNIYPRFAQSVALNYKAAVNGVNATQFLATGDLYFPGLFTNHSLVINTAYQQRDKEDNGGYSNDFPFVRGYQSRNLYQLSKVSASYHFPLFYPDAGLFNAVYLSRVRGAVFYEYGHGNDFYSNGSPFKADFKSTGGQLFFDGQLWNQLPYRVGIRYSHLLDRDIFGGSGSNRVEIVLPISLF